MGLSQSLSRNSLRSTARQIRLQNCSAEELQEQIKFLKSLEHPNILKVLQVHPKGQSKIQVVEECCETVNLMLFIENKLADPVQLMKDVAAAVRYLHVDRKVIHYHISLRNIFMRAGKAVLRGTSRLGIEREVTFHYQAPEQGQGMYGYQSDIYSLGVVFLELLHGRALEESKEGWLVKQGSNQVLQDIEDFNIRNLILQMLDKHSKQRPSIQEVCDALGLSSIKNETSKEIVERLMTITKDYWNLKLEEKTLEGLLEKHRNIIEIEALAQNPTAMFLFGRIYQALQAVEDHLEAEKWFLKAASSGNHCAYFNLFLEHIKDDTGKEYLMKGVEHKDNRCVWQYGRCIGFGFRGFTIELEKALETIKSLPSDFPDAIYNIVRLTTKIKGVQSFPSEYEPMLIQGAVMNHRKAIQALGDCFTKQRRYQKAMKCYLIASLMRGDCIENESELAHSNGSCMDDLADRLSSVSWIKLALKKGSRFAKRNIIALRLF